MQSKFYVQIHSVPFSHLLSVGPTHLGPNNIFCRLGGGGLNDFGGLKFWVTFGSMNNAGIFLGIVFFIS